MDSRVITITSGKGGVRKTTTTANLGTALAMQGIEQGFRNAIVCADEIIIVANPEMASVRDADRIIGLVEAAGKPEPRLILNRLRAEMVKRGDMMDVADVLEVLGIDLLGIIPED